MAAMDIPAAVANVKTMLGSLTAWQTICQVDNSADALKRIYRGGVKDDGDCTLCPIIFLDSRPVSTNWLASRVHGELPVEIRMELAIPDDKQETYETEWVWMHEQLAAMLAGINGAVQGSGQLMLRSLDVTMAPGLINPDDNQGRREWGTIMEATMDFI